MDTRIHARAHTRSYLIREFAKNIVWIKASQAGTPLAIEKIDKATDCNLLLFHCYAVVEELPSLRAEAEMCAPLVQVEQAAHQRDDRGLPNGVQDKRGCI